MDDEDFLEDEGGWYFSSEEDEGNMKRSEKRGLLESKPRRSTTTRPHSYTLYNMEELKDLYAEMLSSASELLSLEVQCCHLLLAGYNWELDSLVQDWMDSQERVFKKVGVSSFVTNQFAKEKTPQNEKPGFFCPILADWYCLNETDMLSCTHRFSAECWKLYLSKTLLDGVEAVVSRTCPEYKCPQPVPVDFWHRYLSTEDYLKFEGFILLHFVDTNPSLRWCTRADCKTILMLKGQAGREGLVDEVTCECSQQMCFQCGDEPHRPVPCEVIKKWHKKNQNEAENMTWILVNTKNCPGCKKPIEKNAGCLHMKCRCGYEFCWLCLEDWKDHVATVNFYRCNRYDDDVNKNSLENQGKRQAKESLERYTHFFERYRFHKQARSVATNKLAVLMKEYMQQLHNSVGDLVSSDFLEDAVLQIIECRRMLEWSYAFGYFATLSVVKKDLFEYHQGQLERTLDTLQEMTQDFEPSKYVGSRVSSYGPLFTFKTQLVNLTRVVKNFFQKMKEAFEIHFLDSYTQDAQENQDAQDTGS